MARILWHDGARAVIQRANPGSAPADPAKVRRVMGEWTTGTLRSHGRRVTNYRQAVAIALAEGRRARRQTMRRNPRGGGMGVMELALLGGAAYFLFRTPAPGQPSLFSQFTAGLPGTAPIPGQLTVPATSVIPMGYRQVSVTPSGQRVIAPVPPGSPGYIPTVYQTATTASGLTGALTSIVQQIGALFGASPAGAAQRPPPVFLGPPVLAPAQPVTLPDGTLATPQMDSSGQVVGWYRLNGDGTTTTWSANGQNPMTTDPVTGAPLPDTTLPALTLGPTFTDPNGVPNGAPNAVPYDPNGVPNGVPLQFDLTAPGPSDVVFIGDPSQLDWGVGSDPGLNVRAPDYYAA